MKIFQLLYKVEFCCVHEIRLYYFVFVAQILLKNARLDGPGYRVIFFLFHTKICYFIRCFDGERCITPNTRIVPSQIDLLLTIFQAATIPIFVLSKIPQIISNFQTRTCGQLSFATMALQFGGSAARVFTTLVEVNDNVVLMGFLIGATLNGILLFQTLFFPEATIKKRE